MFKYNWEKWIFLGILRYLNLEINLRGTKYLKKKIEDINSLIRVYDTSVNNWGNLGSKLNFQLFCSYFSCSFYNTISRDFSPGLLRMIDPSFTFLTCRTKFLVFFKQILNYLYTVQCLKYIIWLNCLQLTDVCLISLRTFSLLCIAAKQSFSSENQINYTWQSVI